MEKELSLKIRIDSKTGELKVLGSDLDTIDKKTSRSKKSVDSFSSSLGNMARAAVGLYTLKQIFDTIYGSAQKFTATAMEFEKFATVLQTVEGNADKAKISMQWIADFSTKTPYELANVTESFVKLRAYGIDPTDQTLRSLGDASSAMGKPLIQAVEAMADAVVGENERLKEFGIRATKTGDQIKYTWQNASGQTKQAVIQNNGEIIKSTLNSIFNSKYAGAMEQQSKTLNGMLSNISDSYTQFQNNIMGAGIYDYLKAITSVVGEELNLAFDYALDGSGTFATYTIDVIKAVITSTGSLYDVLEGVGDVFNVVRYSGETAFYGVASIGTTVASSIGETFVDMANGVIDTINWIISSANSTGFFNIALVGHIDKTDILKADIAMKEKFEESSRNLSASYDDLFTSGGGSEFVQKLLTKIDTAYKEIQNKPDIQTERKDFGETVQPDSKKETPETQKLELENFKADTQDLNNTIEDIDTSIDQTTTAIEDFGQSIYSDSSNNDDLYNIFSDTTQAVYDTNKAMSDFTNSANNIDYAMDNATKAIDQFVFRFEDALINSISSNAQTLYSIGSQQTGFTDISYQDALDAANSARDDLINNPLDKDIGETYTVAFNQLLDSASNYINDTNNFATIQEYDLAKATIGTQIEQFQQTALQGHDVLDSMNDLLGSINKAFEDGILSDAERADIRGVADNVNSKNEILLGSTGVVGAIGSQVYYNNAGLATSADLIGSNSVSEYVKKLYGSNGKGISLESISSAIPDLSVDTGLDVSQLANLSQISTNTADTSTNALNTKTAVSTMAGGKNLGNLQIKSETLKINPYYTSDGILTESRTTTYTYYAAGGYTGNGYGVADHTGYKPAGIVHENEWVAPEWMINANPYIFQQLEAARQSGSFAVGGYTSPQQLLHKDIYQPTIIYAQNDNKILAEILREFIDIKQLSMNQLNQQIKMNKLLNKLSNGGEAFIVEEKTA